MAETFAFERSHTILIDASPAEVLDYVSNPNSWPEWIAASHAIHSPNRPLDVGDTFYEEWHTRTGGVRLDWIVKQREHPRLWIAETQAPFLGPIVVTYTCDVVDGKTRYTRGVANPARPKPPSEEMIARVDEEARVSLENIKRHVEARRNAGR